MRRMILSALLVVLLLTLSQLTLLAQPKKALALADIDQSCQYGLTPPQYAWMSHEPIQTFIPTKEMLDAVGVYVKPEIGTSVPLKMEVISENVGGAIIASSTQTIPDGATWVTFDLTDVAMPLGLYGIKLSDGDPNKKAIWYQGPGSCYDRGYAVWDNAGHLEVDFRFATYGYNSNSGTPSAPDQGSTGNDQSTSSSSTFIGVSKGSGLAPAVTTSSAIVAPTNLIATNESNYTGTGIRLSWSASGTSSISGYKIYRSSSNSGGFAEIGRTINGVTIYLDSVVTIGQTYYYFVRAYSGNSESASSNVASATVKDTFKEDILNDYKNNSSGGIFGGLLFVLARFIVPLIIFGLIFILFIVGIILWVRRRKQNQAEQNQTKESKK